MARMPRRSCLARRCSALALLLLPVAGTGLAACGDDTVVLPGDGGGTDATIDSVDATEEPEAEASCAVDAGPLDDAVVALGLQLVQAHKCQDCHGQVLSGNNDGVPSLTAEGGTAYPPNLTSDPATGLGCWTNDQIENAILNGIDDEGMPLCAPMPLFGHIDGGLDPAQAQAVIEYMRSLPIVHNQVADTPACPVPEAGVDAQGEAGTDAGTDASTEAGSDAAFDAGDAAADGGADAAVDANLDANPEASQGGDGSPEGGD